jgi:hypothetical protein
LSGSAGKRRSQLNAKDRRQGEAEEAGKAKREADEATQLRKEAADIARKQSEAEERARRKAEAEKVALAKEAARQQKEADEAIRKQREAEEKARRKAEADKVAAAKEAARRQKEAEEAARKQRELEEARQRSEQLRAELATVPVDDWGVDHVCVWLEQSKLGHLQGEFRKKQITGHKLSVLTSASLLAKIGVRSDIDQALVIKAVERLQSGAPVSPIRSSSEAGSPARHSAALPDSFGDGDLFDIDAAELELGTELGRGHFGVVLLGKYRGMAVAIKKMDGACRPPIRRPCARRPRPCARSRRT